MFPSLEEWYASGQRIKIHLPRSNAHHEIFCRVEGDGAWLTLLHGFPACSWDWARVHRALAPHFRLLCFDFLGYGDSDKPLGHRFSVLEFADLTEAVWAEFGIRETKLVGHDVGAGVSQELLARQQEGRLGARIAATLLMNAAVISDNYRARPLQKLFLNPLLGPCATALLSEKMFTNGLAAAFSVEHPASQPELHAYWLAMTRRRGHKNFHRLMHYIPERRIHKRRWEAALESHQSSLHFVWGMADPFTGAYVADDVARRLPQARLVRLAGVGHFPQIEVPSAVAAETLQSFDTGA
jgi:pimeloyl-ACP methyl ester carboxylesterase